MPKITSSGKPRTEELPGTLQRSPEKAQRTFAKAHDSAVETYGEGEQAHRVAYGAVKCGTCRARWISGVPPSVMRRATGTGIRVS